jgi:asparagine synthase (glutamine-hydrolysing)
MCGIAGYIGTGREQDPARVILNMTYSMKRRGPDSSGQESWNEAILGHRRLAILDLSEAGHQPMLSEDRGVGVVFNGCIYNFLELREQLEKAGHRFRSNCDTEVLLRGYEQWGIDTLTSKLRGMFAFAVWDERNRKLSLVRDRLGVKPLVYVTGNGWIAFASTVKALRDAGLLRELNPRAVLEFLEFGWVSDREVIFSGASKVPAASIIEWKDGSITEREYWTPPQPSGEQLPPRIEAAAEEAEALLLESVRLRLISDVPIGTLLSGGIDSALVCWAMAKLNANITAFTVGTPGDDSDETAAAEDTARRLGIPHKVIDMPAGEQPELDDLIGAYGEPFACSSALAMLRVCRAVKPEATVLVTGDGGDDVFLGYTHHQSLWTAQCLANRLPAGVAPFWSQARRAIPQSGPFRRFRHLLDYSTGGLGAVTRVHDGLPFYLSSSMFGERLAEVTLRDRQIPLSFDSARSLLADYLEYERRSRFVAEYMTKVDGSAMHYAVEARSPFLDQKLWEFAASLPIETRLHGGQLKAVLRHIARVRVGRAVAVRRKQGFTVPASKWLAASWKQYLEAAADGSILEENGWLRPGSLREAADAALRKGEGRKQLWYLVVFEFWARRNLERQTAAALV